MEIEKATEEDCVLIINPKKNFHILLPKMNEEENVPDYVFMMTTIAWLLSQPKKFSDLMQKFSDECEASKIIH